jgi:DNA-binding response OmpR family regulator
LDNLSHILVIDDDPDIHAFIKHDLKNQPFNIVSAYTIDEAVDALGAYDFTFALIDILLGNNESSNEIIRYLKQDTSSNNKFLPFAIMSSRMDDEYARKVLLKGPSVFSTFKKPLRPGVIGAVLKGESQPSVLVIDDDPDILSLIKRELVEGGFQVFSTPNETQARKLLKTTTFIGAIIDNKLGVGEDSEGFIKFLSGLSHEVKVPIVLTGKKINEGVYEDESLLVFEAVKNPFRRGAFVTVMNDILLWKKNLAEASEASEDDDVKIKGTTQNFKEEIQKMKGHHEDDDEEMLVSGDDQEDLSSMTIKGSKDEKESSQVISGEREEIKEEITLIEGDSFHPESDIIKIKGFSPDEDGKINPNKRNSQGLTPAMAYCYSGDLEMVKELVEGGADLRLKARNGKTCLHYAAHSKNYELVEYLINSENLKINDRDEDGREPLFEGIKAKDPQMVKTFISLGARVRNKFDGKNYLTLSVLLKAPEVAKVLIEQGVSANDKDYKGKSAYDYALKLGFSELANLMKK